MEKIFNALTVPVVWIVSVIELALLVYLVYKFVKTKSLFILMTAIITFGLFFDAFIISLGSVISAEKMLFVSRVRFILHGGLVPLLFIIAEESIEMKKPLKITFFVLTGVFIAIGIVNSFLATYKVTELAGVSRLVVDKEVTPKIVQKIPTVFNVISIIPLIVIGIIQIKKNKNVHLLLSGALMFFFSVIGPVLGLFNYLFLLSMFGEICLIVFAILFYLKEDKRKAKLEATPVEE